MSVFVLLLDELLETTNPLSEFEDPMFTEVESRDESASDVSLRLTSSELLSSEFVSIDCLLASFLVIKLFIPLIAFVPKLVIEPKILPTTPLSALLLISGMELVPVMELLHGTYNIVIKFKFMSNLLVEVIEAVEPEFKLSPSSDIELTWEPLPC